MMRALSLSYRVPSDEGHYPQIQRYSGDELKMLLETLHLRLELGFSALSAEEQAAHAKRFMSMIAIASRKFMDDGVG